MKVDPRYLQPRLIDYRPGKVPDVFTVMCFGPVGKSSIEMMGRTRMTHERRTIVRLPDEADESLQRRVDMAVLAFKDKYGWNQHVSVFYDHDATPELGRLWRSWDDLINLRDWVHHMKRDHTSERDQPVADMILSRLNAEMRRQGVGCVPPGLH